MDSTAIDDVALRGRLWSAVGSMALCVAMLIAVVWAAWLARTLSDEAESGGGLMVAAIQLSIMFGSAFGRMLYDRFSVVVTLTGGSVLLVLGALVVGSGRRIGVVSRASGTQ